jgi:elongation factor Ts
MKQDPKMAGKPDEMLTKIADGKMGAFFKEQTLTAQAFVKDGSKTVADYLKESGDVKVTEFKRVALG